MHRILLALFMMALTGVSSALAVERLSTKNRSQIVLQPGRGELVRLVDPIASVFLADPDIADVKVASPNVLYVFGQNAGRTDLYALSATDELVVKLDLVVNEASDDTDAARSRLGQETGVKVAELGDDVVAEGTTDSLASLVKVDRLLDSVAADGGNGTNLTQYTGPTQVNLRVRFAEVSRDLVEQFGVNWEAVINAGDLAFAVATPTDINIVDGVLQRTPVGSNLFAGLQNTNLDINALVDALAEESMVNLLAEPNLTALSGETASFLAGGEFPVPVPQENGSITVNYREFGVSLAFTPTILPNERISLSVMPEVSQLSTTGGVQINGFSVPSILTRRADTTVELGSGQSFAIAGLFQRNVTQDFDRIPGFGDVPILGPLFRSSRFQRSETELVIIITPYLVEPVSNNSLVAPGDFDNRPTSSSQNVPDDVTQVSSRGGFVIK